ncbi:hypothetical protein [Runella slithyformis]|uniref:Uncharacterized protein n=1 Tax=Runella slithyformis (strain ATCC 29530 / DSM 19594 / LMG 11500 / NCIMB 11436 / LSU 4) TaxID=761193 RepID=A0A7U3ZGE2_RUNSL|nr:hypothetical protein [Runella slithyformis]AEI46746.1 hypothetical protein Runsl_0294 [Runella slithyformis DSM 19594]
MNSRTLPIIVLLIASTALSTFAQLKAISGTIRDKEAGEKHHGDH